MNAVPFGIPAAFPAAHAAGHLRRLSGAGKKGSISACTTTRSRFVFKPGLVDVFEGSSETANSRCNEGHATGFLISAVLPGEQFHLFYRFCPPYFASPRIE